MLRIPSPSIVGSAVLLALFTAPLHAGALNPGSLLVYPEYDNRAGAVSLLTITNTDRDEGVRVEFTYVGVYDWSGDPVGCIQSTAADLLTPLDTLTYISNAHMPEFTQGFMYAYATTMDGEPISFNALVGAQMQIDGINAFEYSINPIPFESPRPHGSIIDTEDNGVRDFDGYEYEAAPAQIVIPRFLGQGHVYSSELILIGLTGTEFDIRVSFALLNDNEEMYTTEHVFNCWSRVLLQQVSGFFHNDFLANWTNHDPGEILGADFIESGWFAIRGRVANSALTSIPDPPILAALVERTGSRGSADLPFGMGKNARGKLLPTDLLGQD